MKLCVVPGIVPVALKFNSPLLVPYRTIPVAERSVLKVMVALVVPESVAFAFEANDTRVTTMEVDPVFPERSVARAVMVFAPFTRLLITFDQVPELTVAVIPFTETLATPPESDTVPEKVGEPVTVAPLA